MAEYRIIYLATLAKSALLIPASAKLKGKNKRFFKRFAREPSRAPDHNLVLLEDCPGQGPETRAEKMGRVPGDTESGLSHWCLQERMLYLWGLQAFTSNKTTATL